MRPSGQRLAREPSGTRVNSRIALRAAPWLPWNARGGGDQGGKEVRRWLQIASISLAAARLRSPDPALRAGRALLVANGGVRLLCMK